jgi:4-amino-4-deoxy-L-arabinose transferase-like glycosyltransferase
VGVISGRISVALAVAVAALCWLEAPHALLGYDQMFHLVWAWEILHGHAPELRGALTPTPHPLELALALPMSVLGRLGEDGMRLVALVSLPAAALAVGRLGTRLVGRPVGVLAAVLLVTRPHLLELAQHGDPDLPALALMSWAAVLALERRDTLVLLLLAAVGLLRPEPWLFALLYAAWAGRRAPRGTQLRLAALALLAPVLWGLHDWVVAGAPFWSFTQTRANGAVQGDTGFGVALRLLPHHAGYLVALPALVVGVAGAALGLALMRRASLAIAAVGATFVAGFLFYGLTGLTLSPRYLVVLAPVIALFAAIGALGWTALPDDHAWRARWRAIGAVGLVVLVAGIPGDVAKHAQVRTALLDQGAQLEPLARRQAGVLRRCVPVRVTAGRAIPYVARWIGAPVRDLTLAGGRSLVSPTPATVSDLAGRPPVVAAPAPGMRPLAADARWRLYASC